MLGYVSFSLISLFTIHNYSHADDDANEGCKCCATFARLRVVAAIIFKFYRKFYCSCDQSFIRNYTHSLAHSLVAFPQIVVISIVYRAGPRRPGLHSHNKIQQLVRLLGYGGTFKR